jgi:hypothetical protein
MLEQMEPSGSQKYQISVSYKMITLAKIMKIGPKINNLELLLDIRCFLEAKNIKFQFRTIWYPWLKSWILGLSQPEATFGHLEPPESQKYIISVSCNLIPLAKIIILGLKINLNYFLSSGAFRKPNISTFKSILFDTHG